MKIFVVDDDPFALRLATHQLETIGLTDVLTFEAAKQPLALLAVDAKAADVILLDLAMPDMDGLEFVQQLARMKFPGVVIFISGMDDGILQMAPVLARGLKLRVGGALKKPSTPEQLRGLLDAIAPR
ncbi:MAG: response regulator [Gemmatimonadaceae bacterium]|nr:response regulator [Gemmatimonadaceae bacterium]